MNRTKRAYEEYLNEVGQDMTLDQLDERYSLGSHRIHNHDLGTFLRRYDPIQFEVGYNEWRQEGSIDG